MALAEPTPERWEFRAQTNDYRCRVHDIEFDRGCVCPDCDNEPAPQTEVGEESEHDKELARRETEWRTDAKWCAQQARKLAEIHDHNLAVKYLAERAKLERLAVENREKRAARDHDRMLVRHRREMAGLRASH